jgi:galactoside O-acetyltransferase
MGANVAIDIGARIIGPQEISIGDNTWIDKYAILAAGASPQTRRHVRTKENRNFRFRRGELVIGNGCHIAPYVVIQAHGGCYIGDFTGIASGCKVYSLSHHYKGPMDGTIVYKFTPMVPEEEQSMIEGPIVFEGNNALGLNSVVFPGVTIGRNSWIGVCSYVIEDVPGDIVAIGTPSKVLKRRASSG